MYHTITRADVHTCKKSRPLVRSIRYAYGYELLCKYYLIPNTLLQINDCYLIPNTLLQINDCILKVLLLQINDCILISSVIYRLFC